MQNVGKMKAKLQKKLRAVRGWTCACRVCGSHHGLKTSRESYGLRCTKCIRAGLHTEVTLEYEALKKKLDKLNGVESVDG